MKDVLHNLFSYNYHTNNLFYKTLRKTETAKGKPVELFSHILNAHAIWLARIEQTPPPYDVWASHTLDMCEQLNQDLYHQSRSLLNNMDEGFLEKVIYYQNTKGISYQNTTRDIFLHIINHGTHHRAQISLLIRQQGHTPPVSDYILYKRAQS